MPLKIEELERRAKFNPTPQNFFFLAEAYKDEMNFEKAFEACSKGLEKQPDSISGQVLLAEILFKLGRLDESLNLLSNIIRKAPDTARAYRILYEVCIQKKDFYGAKDALEKLFFFNPFDEDISQKLMEISRLIEKREKVELPLPEQEPVIERGTLSEVKESPLPPLPEESPPQEELLATRRIEEKDIITMAREVKEEEGEDAFVTPTMAEIYLKQGLIDKAIETYYKLFELKKDEMFLSKAKELEEKVKKASYYSAYAKLLEKFLERINQLKKERTT
jgi:tetratricopeptide (TPR) repeat protein